MDGEKSINKRKMQMERIKLIKDDTFISHDSMINQLTCLIAGKN